jgi:hypothetical protein
MSAINDTDLPRNLEKLYQVTAPPPGTLCAGAVSRAGIITDAAPVLRWLIGKHEVALISYCQHRRWKVEIVSSIQIQ